MLPRPSRTHAAIPEANVASQAIPTATPDTTATKIPSLATNFQPLSPLPQATPGSSATKIPSFTSSRPSSLTHSNVGHHGNPNPFIRNHFQSSSPHPQQHRAPRQPKFLHWQPFFIPNFTYSNVVHHGNQNPFIHIFSVLISSPTAISGTTATQFPSFETTSQPLSPHPQQHQAPRQPKALHSHPLSPDLVSHRQHRATKAFPRIHSSALISSRPALARFLAVPKMASESTNMGARRQWLAHAGWTFLAFFVYTINQ